jgi:hypothetical protein
VKTNKISMKSLRIVLDIVAAALILITAFFCASCGSPSSDSSDPSGGNDGTGGSASTGGSTGGDMPPGTTPAVLGPDGQWHCKDGVMIKADDNQDTPLCRTQPITSPPDASAPPPDTSTPPEDASPPEPDTPVSTCPPSDTPWVREDNLVSCPGIPSCEVDPENCTASGFSDCILHQDRVSCTWSCAQDQYGDPLPPVEDWPQDHIASECWVAEEGLELECYASGNVCSLTRSQEDPDLWRCDPFLNDDGEYLEELYMFCSPTPR